MVRIRPLLVLAMLAAVFFVIRWAMPWGGADLPPTESPSIRMREFSPSLPGAEQLRVASEVEALVAALPGMASSSNSGDAADSPMASDDLKRSWGEMLERCMAKRVGLLEGLMKGPRGNMIPCVWTSEQFNPRKRPVSIGSMDSAEAVWRSHMEVAERLYDLSVSVASREFRTLLQSDRGAVPFVSEADYRSMLKRRFPDAADAYDKKVEVGRYSFDPALGFAFDAQVVMRGDGGWYGARVYDLPAARVCVDAQAFVGLELVRLICQSMSEYGLLEEQEIRALLRRASEIAERELLR